MGQKLTAHRVYNIQFIQERSDGGYIVINTPKYGLPYKFFLWLLVVINCQTLAFDSSLLAVLFTSGH